MVKDSPTAHLLISLHLGSFMIQARGTWVVVIPQFALAFSSKAGFVAWCKFQ